jgi:hypothetical protein
VYISGDPETEKTLAIEAVSVTASFSLHARRWLVRYCRVGSLASSVFVAKCDYTGRCDVVIVAQERGTTLRRWLHTTIN